MDYGATWDRECADQLRRWSRARRERELDEEWEHPDGRLDEVGWDIFYCAIARGMDEFRAVELAMDGNYWQRQRVRKDMFARRAVVLRKRYAELHPTGVGIDVFETQAPDQLEFWRKRLTQPDYVYFIQSGANGPIKIGLSRKPENRISQLQTGNPDELLLRHVIPGNRSTETHLHHRFRDARIRGEWFGREYLPIILAFAGGLADEMIHAYDGRGVPPSLNGATVRTEAEVLRIRAEIERLWNKGFDIEAVAEFAGLDVDEVVDHLVVMRRTDFYSLPSLGQSDLRVVIREFDDPI